MSRAIRLRDAAMSDSDLLLEWRNDPETREQSIRRDPVSREEHLKWLKKSLAAHLKERKIWIAEEIETGSPVGTVRADLKADGSTELSWTVAPSRRGQGYGFLMVQAAMTKTSSPYICQIRAGNLASLKIAEKLGFQKLSEKNDLLSFRKS